MKKILGLHSSKIRLIDTLLITTFLLTACFGYSADITPDIYTTANTLQSIATSTPTYTTEPSITPTSTATPEPTSTPIKDFTYFSELDLMNWRDFELIGTIEYDEGYVVKTVRETLLYGTPLFDIEEEDTSRPLRIINLPAGFHFELMNEKTFQDNNGRELKIANLRNSLGGTYINAVLSLVTAYQYQNGEIVNYVQQDEELWGHRVVTYENFDGYRGSVNIGSFTDEIRSLLKAIYNLLQYQIENGSFNKDHKYVFTDVINYYPVNEESEFHHSAQYYQSTYSNSTVSELASSFYRLVDDENMMTNDSNLAEVTADVGLPGGRAFGPSSPFNDKYSVGISFNEFDTRQNRNMEFTPRKNFYVGVEIFLTSGEFYGSENVVYIFNLYIDDNINNSTMEKVKESIETYDSYLESLYDKTVSPYNINKYTKYEVGQVDNAKLFEIIAFLSSDPHDMTGLEPCWYPCK